ncbi:MAG TPA: DUF721 domain-containing protein [Cyclobacteriaceae bacterium]|nr:DUF721 domain-containing protein [Cyclobacteriaceae bacterium]
MQNKKPGTTTIKSAFGDMLKTFNLESKFNAARIRKDWEKLMGKTVNNRTSRIRINHGKIAVYLTSAPLKNELNMSKSKILEILRKEYGEEAVTDIIFL